jgi:hypothetical protein
MIDAFKAMPLTLKALLDGVSQERATAAKCGDEGWSVVEVICHLRDAEEIALKRDAKMAEEDNPTIIPFDQEKLAIEHDYANQDLRQALDEFIHFRQKHIALLEKLDSEDWKRPGEHLEMGRITIFAHVLHMVCHDAIHSAQISQQLNAIA